MAIRIILLVLFFVLTISVGIFSRKRAANVKDYVLGGRSVGPWLSAFSYGATYFSAVVMVGFAGQFGWRFGISSVWIGLGNALIGSLAAWYILGRRTRVMTKHLRSATMPAFFGKRFNSNALKIGASAIAFVFLIPYTASLYNGLSRLFSMALGIPFEWCIIIMGVITAVFVVLGGYFAGAVNDLIQGVLMLGGLGAIVFVVLRDNGGFASAISQLAHVTEEGADPGVFASFFGPDPLSLLGVVILTSLGAWGLPQMVARFYSIKSEKMITKGAVVSTVFAIVIAGGAYFFGSFGRLYSGLDGIVWNEGGTPAYDSIVPAMLASFGDVMVTLVVVLVFAASISTLSSLVLASSSTLTLDFLKGHVIKNMSAKVQLVVLRLFVAVFIIIASALAIFQYTSGTTFIAQLMGISWGALAGAFLAPFLYGLYWKRVTKPAVWCCFIFSTVLMVANILFRDFFPSILQSPINAGSFAMLFSLILIPIVSLLTKRPEQKLVDHCFECIKETRASTEEFTSSVKPDGEKDKGSDE